MIGDLDPSLYIPKEKLEHGAYYFGKCRNADIARWDGEKQEFIYWREKFRSRFTETIKYPSDDQVFDIFYPFKRIYGTQGLRPIRFEAEQQKLETLQNQGRKRDDVVELPESGFLAFVRQLRQTWADIEKPKKDPNNGYGVIYRLVPDTVYHHVKQMLWRLEQYEVIVEPPKDDSLTQ